MIPNAKFALVMDSPVGALTLTSDGHALTSLLFEGSKERPGIDELKPDAIVKETKKQLEEFFARKRKTFEVPLLAEGTDFQREVWGALTRIPYGETRSYAQLAKSIGKPKAMRAVGAANGRNPIAIIVPCHRVIGADGSLTGFGGGMENKARLLDFERGQLRF